MAYLPESSSFDEGVYQLELTDPVIGGPSGVSNAPLKNLANRTRWLKNSIESLVTYLTETYAAKASPTFTGTPAAPTPAQFDNDTSLATTAFVKRALGNYRSADGALANGTTISASHIGGVWQPNENATITVPTPDSIGCGSGDAVTIAMGSRAGVTLNAGSGAAFYANNTLSSLSLAAGQVVTLVATGPGWYVFGSLKNDANFAASLATNGYQKLPSGLIIQWGKATVLDSSGSLSIQLPVAFPTACVAAFGNPEADNSCAQFGTLTTTSIAGASIDAATGVNSPTGAKVFWLAIGF